MKGLWVFGFAIALAACCAQSCESLAQEPGCLEIARMGAVARANTVQTLKTAKQKAGDSYRARLIFAARMLEIDPNNKSAAADLLGLIPKDESGPEQTAWLDLTQLQQCPSGGISDSYQIPLDTLQYRLPRLAARAALLAPDEMFDYVSYTLFALNPESDYTVQMRKVCRLRHRQFVAAVNKLSPKDKEWFVSQAFNPDGCRTIAYPEQ